MKWQLNGAGVSNGSEGFCLRQSKTEVNSPEL